MTRRRQSCLLINSKAIQKFGLTNWLRKRRSFINSSIKNIIRRIYLIYLDRNWIATIDNSRAVVLLYPVFQPEPTPTLPIQLLNRDFHDRVKHFPKTREMVPPRRKTILAGAYSAGQEEEKRVARISFGDKREEPGMLRLFPRIFSLRCVMRRLGSGIPSATADGH